MTSDERLVASRHVPVPPSKVFTLLTDPTRHHETEPTDWVRTPLAADPITGVGDVFGMNMYREGIGGAYVMHNRVTVFEPDRAIGWSPGQLDGDGGLNLGGWWWRYDLEPADDGTKVTLTYDWSGTPQAFRDTVGTPPPFAPEFLDQSLEALELALARS